MKIIPDAIAQSFTPHLLFRWKLSQVAICCVSAMFSVSAQAQTPHVVHADIVALDQLLVYNRFGSFNPFGMMFALRRDVSDVGVEILRRPDADICGEKFGTEPGTGPLAAGKVRLKECKRPRPLVLRANAGDILEITLTNLLRPDQPEISDETYADPPTARGKGFCGEPRSSDRQAVAPIRPDTLTAFGDTQCDETAEAANKELASEKEADIRDGKPDASVASRPGGDWPRTRGVSLVMPGLEAIPIVSGQSIHGACTGMDSIKPDQSVTCRWRLEREGTHLFSSLAAPAGGEGDAGSLGHGLFGALIVEPAGSRAFRSQVTSKAFDEAWGAKSEGERHARSESISFAKTRPNPEAANRVEPPLNSAPFVCNGQDIPILAMRRVCDGSDAVEEIVHSDLNAIIVPRESAVTSLGPSSTEAQRREWRQQHEAQAPFREFTVVFHDELKTYYADNFKYLSKFGQLSAARDGFAINYGASSVGSAVLANRLKIGPAANCPECLYEEFFLESWANGDPALLEAFPDDPSNVHHSYLNDKVVFRNFHAGKETHVFHLHSHQWFAGNDAGRGAYLDSQTIGPQQGFTYRIYHGGLERFATDRTGAAAPKGWWDTLGSGNRNRTPGDAIFHCHLYPHFAQGMWALWRVHDVLEDGTRVLPDGQKEPGLSTMINADPLRVRSGSVGLLGEWIEPAVGERRKTGTPVPGLVPLPGQGLPMLPTYTRADAVATAQSDGGLLTDAMPGYPFYVPGRPGHRSPQPPLDMARAERNDAAGITERHVAALGRPHLDGGLPRHLVVGGEATPTVLTRKYDVSPVEKQKILDKPGALLARMLALGNLTSEFDHLKLELLPQSGTALERNAMSFHSTGAGVRIIDPAGAALSDGPPLEVVGQQFDGAELKRTITTKLDPATAAYPTQEIPIADVRAGGSAASTLTAGGRFAVNGSPGAPGAPFADPCGSPLVLARANGPRARKFDANMSRWANGGASFQLQTDPFGKPVTGVDNPLHHGFMVPDPGLLGFRRYDVSAVELKLIVNRAGWHDPQARIDVLSQEAADYKNRWRSDAEPFFFRAFSGECIEFRHTNETPKKLKLDDFQLQVPTDTIGQHIHLVKFDVTSSDGSGNGFNYEDGTFAPDEVLERICKATRTPQGAVTKRRGENVPENIASRTADECEETFIEQISKKVRLEADNIKYFQTTMQRWFADPILSDDGTNTNVADRTMRTVFTHDHFGPSNIQQHGFYAALLIEPSAHAVCPLAEAYSTIHAGKACQIGPAAVVQPSLPYRLATTPPRDLVGARASVFSPRDQSQGIPGITGDPLHVDAREYAIAIADFALLYDGKPQPTLKENISEDSNGLDRLHCEVSHRDQCKTQEAEPEERPPAEFYRKAGLDFSPTDRSILRGRLGDIRTAYGSPIAAPPRPEAISQKHHDPYLVNYRNEPIPLRIGTSNNSLAPSFMSNPCRIPGPQSGLFASGEAVQSIVRQRPGDKGDLAEVFRSNVHGDPCTPILEGLSGDRIVVRMIQGAQEVQHTFVVEGRPGRRNVDQPYPSERPLGADLQMPTSRAEHCASNAFALSGKSREFPSWAVGQKAGDSYWTDFQKWVEGCDNPLGLVSAQEIGISEHFEVGALFHAAAPFMAPMLKKSLAGDSTAPSPAETPVARSSLDYLYHFGSRDALWNGAWGLVRSYDAGSPDISACLGKALSPAAYEACFPATGGTSIRARLRTFTELRAELPIFTTSGSTTLLEQAARNGGVAPVGTVRPGFSLEQGTELDCPADAPRVRAVAVAMRAEHIFDKVGRRYDQAGLFDRDGLALVPLEPAAIGINRDLTDKPNKSVSEIRALAKSTVAANPGILPYTLRIRAGDCLDLHLINALDEGDAPGDALMPKIVPLNVDSDERQYGGSKSFDEWGASASGKHPAIKPSRKVALSLPLPIPVRKPHGVLPVGVNATGAGETSSAIPPGAHSATRYYAGFIWPRESEIEMIARAYLAEPDQRIEQAHHALVRSMTAVDAELGALGLTPRQPPVEPRLSALLAGQGCAPKLEVAVLGVPLCVKVFDTGISLAASETDAVRTLRAFAEREDQALAAAQKKAISKSLADLDQAEKELLTSVQTSLAEHFNKDEQKWRALFSVPYAFGALPIRSLGDVISHGAHGLSGSLVVEPAISSDEQAADFSYRHRTSHVIKVPSLELQDQRPGATVVDARPNIKIAGGSFREHVLLWQDGLNLWHNGKEDRKGYLNFAGRPMPNCPVCDDSYDLGEKGVSYSSAPFTLRVPRWTEFAFGKSYLGVRRNFGHRTYPIDEDNLNRALFPPHFFRDGGGPGLSANDVDDVSMRPVPTPRLAMQTGEQIAIRIAHPSGRARQRAFLAMIAGYNDLFPGFGSGHSTLLAPGKAMTAWSCAPRTTGTYLWRDGPQPIFAAGAWGHITIKASDAESTTLCGSQ